MIGGGADAVARAEQEVRGLFADEGAHDRAVAWARKVLSDAGLDPSAQQLRAIRCLRRAERRLSLVGARYLVDAAAGAPPSPSRRRRSPLLH